MTQTKVGWRSYTPSQTQSISTLLTSLYSAWNGDTLGTSLDSSIFGAWNGDIQYSSTTLSNSLISAWNANSDTTDSVGTNNGTAVGGLTYTTGKIGNAFQFNGTDSLVSIPNTSGQFNFTGNFTINAWINIPNYSNYNIIFRNYVAGGSYGYGFQLYLATNNVFTFELRNGNNLSQYITNGGIATGSFKMITVVREVGLAPKIYIDGVLNSGAYYVNGNAATNAPGYQSNQVYSIGLGSNHKQDGTSIWNRTLTQAEITQLYSAEYPYVPSANDSVGTNNGTAQGGLTYTTGKIGQAFQFNGTNAYVSFPTNSWNSLVGTDLTISLWVRFASTGNQTLISNMSTPSINVWNGWEIRLVSGQPTFYSWNNSGTGQGVVGSTVAINTWYHIVATKRGSSYKIYMNGSLAASGSGTGDAAVSGTFYPNIGHLQYSSTYHGLYVTNGTIIDSVNLWSKEISTDEVVQLYNAGNGTQYPFSSQTLTSANNQFGIDNGTLMNGCTFTDGKIGKAFTFDGINDYVQLPNNSLNFTGDFSVSFWMKVNSQDAGMILSNLQFPVGISTYYGWQIGFFGGQISFISGSNTGVSTSSTRLLSNVLSGYIGTWVNVTCTHKQSTGYKIYVNGVLNNSNNGTYNPVYTNTHTPSMGGQYSINASPNLYYPFNGSLDVLNVWQKELTQEEVTELYNSGNGKQLTTTPIVTSGLVLNLDASRKSSYPNTGTTWFDISGTGNNGTLTNGPVFGTASGGQITFDGVNDYIDMGTITSLNLTNITVSAWIKPTSGGPDYTPAVCRYSNTTSSNGWELYYVKSTGKFTFGGRENSSAYLSVVSDTTYSLNNWYNITGVKSGNVWSLYVNGVLVKTSTLGSGNIIFATNRMQIGADYYNTWEYGKSDISQTMIYNRALTSTEITQNFNATKSRFGL